MNGGQILHVLIICVTISVCAGQLKFSEDDLLVMVGKNSDVKLSSNGSLSNDTTVWFTYQVGNKDPSRTLDDNDKYIAALGNVTFPADKSMMEDVTILGQSAGHLILGIDSEDPAVHRQTDVFVRINVVKNKILVTINAVIGWIYFAAWSVSFYPQVFSNFKRKSVIGLNFDFLLYNITGFLAYGFFNVGLYWVPSVTDEYKRDHPRGINPVQLNDVIFTLHAIFVTLITIFQCFIYKRGEQRVSKVTLVLVIGAWLFAAISLVVTLFHKITWLTYLYYFSYIKLGVTLIKYVPQAFMNFRRKSTDGWSIGNVLLDFTGGSLSLLQMFLLAYNSDDWSSIFGDPTKFGLGFFSILFDILFMVQHYCLYRHNEPYGSLVDHDYDEKEYLVNKDQPPYSSIGSENNIQ